MWRPGKDQINNLHVLINRDLNKMHVLITGVRYFRIPKITLVVKNTTKSFDLPKYDDPLQGTPFLIIKIHLFPCTKTHLHYVKKKKKEKK